ncbi:antA/AntB antirepressor family protein [Cedecea sp.]|jgi:phage anti-repressor protein|uniref:antA/AntB antirepressor family protein n=1 Tax=Cedecea sp. TaxID=1970739 RepID=UPI002F41D4E2
MNVQLIPVFSGTISGETMLLCNARELHAFLAVGKRFASWIAERLAEYQFVENQDYLIASQNREAKIRGGHNRKDYHLTLDTAKELAMVERNDRGRQIRRYFIECEKRRYDKHQPDAQTVVTLPEPKRILHPTSLDFDIPEPVVIVEGNAVSQLNALFGTVEFLEAEMWPHLQALFPGLGKQYSSTFDTAGLLLSLLKNTRYSCEDAALRR